MELLHVIVESLVSVVMGGLLWVLADLRNDIAVLAKQSTETQTHLAHIQGALQAKNLIPPFSR